MGRAGSEVVENVKDKVIRESTVLYCVLMKQSSLHHCKNIFDKWKVNLIFSGRYCCIQDKILEDMRSPPILLLNRKMLARRDN